MFKYEEGYPFAAISDQARLAEKNYTILPDDYLNLEVYTKDGERIIDPDLELNKELTGTNNNLTRPNPNYLILPDSTVKLPMIGYIKLGGLTIENASRLLEESYSKFYNNPYVVLQYINKRVIVLGATGGQVIPLENENMSVVEIVALSGGITQNTHSENIRLIRGEEVFLVDLSTLEGYSQSNMNVESGDVIYIEPVPRVLSQSAQEVSLIVSTITALTTLLVLILSLQP
ncbi:MAG: polysaccharide export protein EpsE [Saprospiraceae bacterium]|nr:polysaccharide export protein EpsE [Saprospiraceae bacterium]